MKTSKPAQGERGFLIRGMDGQIWFRQYNADHDFVDYDITHYDCEIEIVVVLCFGQLQKYYFFTAI